RDLVQNRPAPATRSPRRPGWPTRRGILLHRPRRSPIAARPSAGAERGAAAARNAAPASPWADGELAPHVPRPSSHRRDTWLSPPLQAERGWREGPGPEVSMRHHPSLPGARGALPLALAALLLACSAPASRPPAAATPAAPAPTTAPAATAQAAQAREHVNLGVLSSVSDSGLWIAIAKGYFEEQGLDVETQPFGTAADMVAPLSAGQLDAGGGAPGVGLNNAVARGLEVRIVADKATTSPGHGYEAILIRKDLVDSGQVRVPADLKGRKYALPSVTGITPEVALNRYMRQAGLGARDTDLITMPFPDMVAAFANRSIDAATVIEPFVTQIADHGDAVIAEREDVTYPNHTVAVILYAAPFSRD